MNLYKKAAKNTEENFRKLLKESREGIAPTFLLPSETAVIRPTSTFGSRDELKNIVKECLREILNENNQEMPSFSQKRPPQNLSITDVNVVVPQQQNGSQQQYQPLPSISTMFDGRRSSAATPINEIERQQMALSRTTTPLPLRFQQPNLRLQTRMTFTSPTSLLPPIPPAPPTLQSPIFRAQNGNGGSSSSSQAAQVNQSQIPACCRYPPPLPLPPGISLEQYHVHLFLQAQRNRFPYPQPPPPTPTPTPTTKSNTIAENLQTAGNNPYLQQFPRIPLDQSEHERLNQMFYANLLRPPTMQPPNSMHSQQSQQQPQQQQPPSTPTPTKRTRKRKSSPEKCPSVLSKPSDIISQQQNQSSTFPLTANIQQQTNNGPVLSSAVELFQPQESEERLINVIQNPNVTVEENENNNNNENADHDSDDIIIIEHEQRS
uniref:Uncharacterized protein n=1 Tax=Panagrolaimus davidi TaxID=227884 RepID=A0A914QE76_9BILA